jgi:spore coat polysaccharide biosynthesis predicted glycosyltransferase SpsG
MADVMREADIAITSAGRTVTELMVLGIPTIALCQNQRELTHTHASSTFGVTNLGLGSEVSAARLAEHIRGLTDDLHVRQTMRARAFAAVAGRSNRRIAERILEAAESARERS